MSGNELNGNGVPHTSDLGEGPRSDFLIDIPSSGSNGITVAENEIADGMSDVHVSETPGALRKDEYDVDFE
jgi:hypothetical protein